MACQAQNEPCSFCVVWGGSHTVPIPLRSFRQSLSPSEIAYACCMMLYVGGGVAKEFARFRVSILHNTKKTQYILRLTKHGRFYAKRIPETSHMRNGNPFAAMTRVPYVARCLNKRQLKWAARRFRLSRSSLRPQLQPHRLPPPGNRVRRI